MFGDALNTARSQTVNGKYYSLAVSTILVVFSVFSTLTAINLSLSIYMQISAKARIEATERLLTGRKQFA